VFSTRADTNGNYFVDGLAPGAYTLRVCAPEFQIGMQTVSVFANQTTDADVMLAVDSGMVSGHVREASNHSPLAGAYIEVLQGTFLVCSTFTDAQGTYVVSNLAPGYYTLRVNAPSFQMAAQQVYVTSHQTVSADFTLIAQPKKIVGIVVDEENKAIAKASIDILQEETVIASTMTSDTGLYLLEGLASSGYDIRVSAPNFQTMIQRVNLQAGDVSTVNWKLSSQPGSVLGSVIDAANKVALLGAVVDVIQGEKNWGTASTDAKGNYAIIGLPPGGYTIRVHAEDFQTAIQGLNIQANQAAIAGFSLVAQPGQLMGQVTVELSEETISQAQVVALQGPYVIATAWTDDKGFYIIEGLAPGSYTIRVQALSYQTSNQMTTLASNQKTLLDFSLHANPCTIDGQITYFETGEAIVAAHVDIVQANRVISSVLTDQHGHYSLTGIAPGYYLLRVSAPDQQTAMPAIFVQSDQNLTVDIELKAQPCTVVGQIFDVLTGEPIQNATIDCVEGTSVMASTLSDSNGIYAIRGLSPKYYHIRATAPFYQAAAQALYLLPNEEREINMALVSHPSRLTGQIVDNATNRGISQAYLTMWQGSLLIAALWTDRQGNYDIENVALGVYTLMVKADGYQTITQEVAITHQAASLSLSLFSEYGSLMGSVIDASDGHAVAGVAVTLLDNDLCVAMACTDIYGNYSIEGVAPGTYILKGSAASYQSGVQGITIQSEQSTMANLTLSPHPSTVSGQVRSVAGQAIPFATVDVFQGNTIISSVQTDANGNYHVEGLPAGQLGLRVSANSFQTTTQTLTLAPVQEAIILVELASNPGGLHGYVMSAVTQQAVSQAIIDILQGGVAVATTRIQPNGKYEISGLAPGCYQVRVQAVGYQTTFQTGMVAANQMSSVDVIMAMEQGRVQGQVVDSLTHLPVAGAIVTVMEEGGNGVVDSGLTDTQGNVLISDLRPGNYLLKGEYLGFQMAIQRFNVQAEETTTVNLSLQGISGSIFGQVTDETFSSLSHIRVDLLQSTTVIASTWTDGQGNYVFQGVGPSNYIVRASSPSFQTAVQQVFIEDTQPVRANFTLAIQGGTVTGYVTDQLTGLPINGVAIDIMLSQVVYASSWTDPNGYYTISGLAPNVYVIRAKSNDFQMSVQSANVQSGQMAPVNLTMQQHPGGLTGCVRDNDTKEPLANVNIDILQNNTFIGSTFTDANGRYGFTGLAPETYLIRAHASGYQIGLQEAGVWADQVSMVNLTMSAEKGSIIGAIESQETHLPLSGASIEVFLNEILISSILTDSQGAYAIAGLPPGKYVVKASINRFQNAMQEVTVESSQSVTINFSLQLGYGSITGYVTQLLSSVAIPNATVMIWQDSTLIGSKQTDGNGGYCILGLAPNRYTLVVSASNFQTEAQQVSVQIEQTAIADFALDPNPGWIQGQVLRASDSSIIEGAIVDVLQGEVVFGTAMTDAEGNYTIEGIAPGSYVIRAVANGFQVAVQGANVLASQLVSAVFYLEDHPSRIMGHVQQIGNLESLPNVDIDVLQGSTLIATTLTDVNGEYVISNMPSGSYTIRVSLSGFQTKTQGVMIEPEQQVNIDFALAPNPGRLEGQILSALTTLPIVGATIHLFQGEILIDSVLTDMSGKYAIEGLPPHSYLLVAAAPSFATSIQTIHVEAEETTTVSSLLQSEPGGFVGGVNSMDMESPVPSAVVDIFQNNALIGSTLTDLYGRYVICNLAPGYYILRASAIHFQTILQGGWILSNQLTSMDFDLPLQSCIILGQVTNPSTALPIVGATVQAKQNQNVVSSALTDSKGAYVLTGLPLGNYVVEAIIGNVRTVAQAVNMQHNQVAVINFAPSPTPSPPRNIAGQVLVSRFVNQTDRVHRITWKASHDPSVVGYHVYRNSKRIATISPKGPFVYEDHHRHKKRIDRYAVTAFNASEEESSPLSIDLPD
jgi:protocatechuate 3,4-dioxygenase beta subunit